METGSGHGSDRRPELAAVSGAMPYEPGEPRFDACVAPAPAPQSGSLFPWSQPSAPAPATASNVGAGQSVMKLCAGQWKDAKAAGTTGGQSWPQFLGAVPHAPRLRRRPVGRFCFGPSSSSGSGARASLPVRLSVSMVAAVGSGFRAGRARDSASRRIHDRARGACAMPVGHRRVGQHADAHLPLFGNALLRAHPKGRVYVRG